MFVRADNDSRNIAIDAAMDEKMDSTVGRAAKDLGFTSGKVGIITLHGVIVPFAGKTVGEIIKAYGTNFRLGTPDMLGN
ncbi:MAG: hypothetical protein KIH08_11830 [Candidatus Freyarchaeota archaeon]|nr:hypothetical protein [Candidatus Jordarchaeia archaeon]